MVVKIMDNDCGQDNERDVGQGNGQDYGQDWMLVTNQDRDQSQRWVVEEVLARLPWLPGLCQPGRGRY